MGSRTQSGTWKVGDRRAFPAGIAAIVGALAMMELSVMEQRYQAVLAVVQDGWQVIEVARRLGVSRQSVHAWIARYEAGGLALGRSKGLWYVLDVGRTRATPLEIERLVAATAERDAAWARESRRRPPAIRMEQEPGSAGITVIDHYRQQVLAPYDFAGVRSTGSKETRARPVAARCEAGDVWVCRGTWNTEFLDELTAFPMGGHDDQVDALSGAYQHLARAEAVPIVAPISVGIKEGWRLEGESGWHGWL